MNGIMRAGKHVVLALAVVTISACSPGFRNHGHVPRESELATV